MKSVAIDQFRLVVPTDIGVRLSEERDTVLLTLPNDCGVIFFSEYTCEPRAERCELMEFLLSEAERFLKECLAPAAKQSGQASVQELEGSALSGYQTVATLEDGRAWIFRLVGDVRVPSYVLIHWNGDPKHATGHVLKVLHSLELSPGKKPEQQEREVSD